MDNLFHYNSNSKLHYRLALWFILGISFAVLMAGCIMLQYDDISSDPLYSRYVGDVYKTKVKMFIFGVKMDISQDKIDYYEIMALSGVGGPEIVPLGYLPPGITLKIMKVFKVSPVLLESQSIIFKAELSEAGRFNGMEVKISSARETYIKDATSNSYILSPEYFEKITDSYRQVP